jgi:AAA ATPase domain
VLPEPNFPVKPDDFIGRQAYLDAFTEALRHSAMTGRMASFAILGDWGIGKSSLLLKLAAACLEPSFRILPVTLSVSKDVSDYMKFAEALCDRLAHALLTSDSLATRIRTEIENWKLTRVNVGALTVDRQPRRYFLSSGSALLRHALLEAWSQFIRPAYAGAIFFLDDLHNLATPTVQDTALIVRDQFQSFGIEGVNLSVCFSAKRDYFSGIRSFAEPAVRFYNKCALEPFSLQETVEYTCAVFGSTGLDSQKLAEWLYGKTLGHPYFLAFISRELWSHYHTRPFANAMHLWPVVFSRLEQGKFNTDLAQLSEKEVALLRAVAQSDHDEFTPAPFVQMFPHQYFKRLAEKGLLIRAGRGRYKLYHSLFRQFLQQQE